MLNQAIFGILTNPSLERLRTVIPYPIYTGTIAALFSLPVFGWELLRHGQGDLPGRTQELPGMMWFVPVCSFAAIASLITVLWLGGWISGFRPFRKRWQQLTEEDFRTASMRLLAAAQAEGYQIVWKSDAGDFVGVMGLALEKRAGPHPGNDFPVRLSYLSKNRGARREAELKLDNRTVVVWDTGERARLEALGSALLSRAA